MMISILNTNYAISVNSMEAKDLNNMRTPEEIRLEIIGLFLDRKKMGVAKYQAKANLVLEQYVDEVSQESRKEILFELISIKQYMEERDAFHGYGQMNDLITKLQLTESKQEQS